MAYCRAVPRGARFRRTPTRQSGEFSTARSGENTGATDTDRGAGRIGKATAAHQRVERRRRQCERCVRLPADLRGRYAVRTGPGRVARAAIDRLVRDAAGRGVRSAVLCNMLIYGSGRGLHRDSVQVPMLMAQAWKRGIVRTVGPELNIWSNVHIDDVVDLYLIALKKSPAGAFYFVENGEASFREMAHAIARRLGLVALQGWSVEDAAKEWGMGSVLHSLGSNSRVRGRRARSELEWAPRHGSVTEWIEQEA